MSKHVLIVSSSPRKGGNSELLCAQFVNTERPVYEGTNEVL